MLDKIFRMLPPRDLKMVVLVCKRWREVGKAPRVWPWVTVTATRENITTEYKVLRRRRFEDAVTSWQHLE